MGQFLNNDVWCKNIFYKKKLATQFIMSYVYKESFVFFFLAPK